MAVLLAYCLVFYLNLHACTAKLDMVSDKKSFASQLPFQSKDAETSKFLSDQHDQDTKGKNTKGSESWKRAMLESSAFNYEENVSTKDKGSVEDIVVMDYAQPHRKPPIHNKGT
ncbi:uncharacterized protein LOC121790576 [Salvia splendens]|uniref:uncharacterized protein LOC121741404 n=1 Tax=Salvia splendens TaxID=180675 RepID=UPI001C274CEF|nr:uncharacterized protein LOC121741404 [Salvia splendens]XP_042044700.1 uncharacterized protein LOC121790576 [Salvia splendens]